MKRFLLFKGDFYYPLGGWHDLAGSFDSVEEAIKGLPTIRYEGADWWHVVDTETMAVVEKGEAQ